MTCLYFVLDKINLFGFLHLDVEGWEAYAMSGDGEALRGFNNTCFVVCEVWYDRDRKKRYLFLRDTDGSGPPCNDVLVAMVEHPNFERD